MVIALTRLIETHLEALRAEVADLTAVVRRLAEAAPSGKPDAGAQPAPAQPAPTAAVDNGGAVAALLDAAAERRAAGADPVQRRPSDRTESSPAPRPRDKAPLGPAGAGPLERRTAADGGATRGESEPRFGFRSRGAASGGRSARIQSLTAVLKQRYEQPPPPRWRRAIHRIRETLLGADGAADNSPTWPRRDPFPSLRER